LARPCGWSLPGVSSLARLTGLPGLAGLAGLATTLGGGFGRRRRPTLRRRFARLSGSGRGARLGGLT
jgi:hypothetical protein